jgi:hypothetical protein
MDSNTAIREYTGGCLCPRPEYYSGRGPNPGDLNGKHLQQLHAGILREQGEAAAASFVRLVERLTDLSATNFLNQFHYWWNNGWKGGALRESGLDVGADGPQREAVGLATIMSALGGGRSDRDKEVGSRSIKWDFFFRIGHKPEREEMSDYEVWRDGFGRRW